MFNIKNDKKKTIILVENFTTSESESESNPFFRLFRKINCLYSMVAVYK